MDETLLDVDHHKRKMLMLLLCSRPLNNLRVVMRRWMTKLGRVYEAFFPVFLHIFLPCCSTLWIRSRVGFAGTPELPLPTWIPNPKLEKRSEEEANEDEKKEERGRGHHGGPQSCSVTESLSTRSLLLRDVIGVIDAIDVMDVNGVNDINDANDVESGRGNIGRGQRRHTLAEGVEKNDDRTSAAAAAAAAAADPIYRCPD
mmetsp:Transcript_20360/g.36536  ORF Transcript_20360/g.36536 Transcript_20360/m.36536 type:complete len:201 (-) Transcript_20360:480-1082(-)